MIDLFFSRLAYSYLSVDIYRYKYVYIAYYAHYDYGLLGNLVNYGQKTPPLYNLSTVTVPVTIFSGSNDWLAVPEDVAWLAAQLPNLQQSINIDVFNHLDFLWAIHVDSYVNDVILSMLADVNRHLILF